MRGIAVEKFDIVKKWGINTYKVRGEGTPGWGDTVLAPLKQAAALGVAEGTHTHFGVPRFPPPAVH